MATETLDDNLREALGLFDAGTPQTTTEVADKLDIGRRTTYNRLDRLVNLGELETKKVGASARVWWRDHITPSAARAPGTAVRRKDNTDQFELLVDAVEEYAIFKLDPDGYIQSWNSGAERIKGYEAETILGEHISTFYTDEDRSVGVPEKNLEAATKNGAVEDEGWRVRDDGTRFWANVTITAIHDEDGQLRGFAKVTRDMTERRTYEQQLSAQAERLKRQRDDLEQELDDVFDRVDDAFYALDEEFRFTYVNERAETYFEASESELLGRIIWEAFDIDDNDPLIEHYETATSSQEPVSFEYYSEPHGIWTSTRVYPGESGLSVYFTDITERKETEEKLRRSEERFRTLMEHSPVSMQIFDADGRPITTNPAWERLWDASREELADYNILEDEQLEAAGLLSHIKDAFDGEVVALPVIHYDPAEIDKPGRSRWIEGYAYPLLQGDGEAFEVAIVHYDITEQKKRERELERYETIVETVTDGVYAVDGEYRFTMVNEAYTEMVGYDRETLLGNHISTVVGDEIATTGEQLRENLRDGTDDTGSIELKIETATGEPITVETRYALLPADDSFEGTAGVVRDVTDRKERERELELFKTIVDTIDDGVYVLDDEFYFTEVNDAYVKMTGYDREELLGAHCTLIVDEEVSAESAERLKEIIDGGAGSATLEADIVRADGSRLRAESNFTAIKPDNAEQPLKVGVVRDVSDRVAHERALEEARNRYRALVTNFPNGAVTLVDEDLCYSTVGGTPIEEADATVERLEGSPLEEILPTELADLLIPRYSDALEGNESVFEEEIGGSVYEFRILPVRNDDGNVFAAMGMSQDITEQKKREQDLREAKLQMEAATEAGAVGTWEWDIQEDCFVAGPSLAKIFGVDPEAAREGVPLDRFISAIHEDDRQRVIRSVDEAVSSGREYEEEYRVWDADGEVRWVVARGHVEYDDEESPITFPGALVDITEQKWVEKELGRQREQLSALNNLHEVAQNITDSVIEQSTREEIEAAVCEGLAGTDSFSFAWIGDVDHASQTLSLRIEAGVEDYFATEVINEDEEDKQLEDPCVQAFLSRDIQVAQDIQSDDSFEQWREQADLHGIRSAAGVPIVHDDRIYGVLGVYADRPQAFEEAEQRVLGQLGEVVGHAIAAVEQKRALMSDEVIELEFYLEDAFASMNIDAAHDGRITLDQAVPSKDEEYLVYGTATEEAWPTLKELVAALPHWTAITELSTSKEFRRFELRMNKPPVLSTVASLGGYIDTARIEDGDVHLIAHLPPSGDVRAVTDIVTEAYPPAELLAQRQISRSAKAATEFDRLLTEELTERQRSALQVAFNTGFFQWPRETTGEVVADSLGVSSPTFHQHLRKAEQKVFQTVLQTAESI